MTSAAECVLDADHVATWDVPTDPAAVADARAHVSGQLTAWGLEDAVFTTELIASGPVAAFQAA